VYDALGRRQDKTINTTATQFLYDGLNPIQELTGTTPVAILLTGRGVDEYFTRTDATGVSQFLADALGSTVALADASGSVFNMGSCLILPRFRGHCKSHESAVGAESWPKRKRRAFMQEFKAQAVRIVRSSDKVAMPLDSARGTCVM
jgi:hypothetical protein